MTNIAPTHILHGDYGTVFHEDADFARQFPDLTFSHLEWEAYAWPGGYPLAYVVADGGCLCPKCVNEHIFLTIDPEDDQFYVVDCFINYEDPHLMCDHCGTLIESAYGDEE